MIIGYRLSEVLPDGTGLFLQSGLENFSFYGCFCSKSGKGGIPRRVGWKFCFSVIMITDVIPTTLETCCYWFMLKLHGNSWLTSARAKRLHMVMGLVDQSGKPVMMITGITPTTLETCCYYFFFYLYTIFLSCNY